MKPFTEKERIFEAASERISKAKKPVIVCGHFKLRINSLGSRAYPGIYQDLRGTTDTCGDGIYLQLNEYAGNTPCCTFEMGVRLVKANLHAKILILVNDQSCHNGAYGVKATESIVQKYYEANILAESFGEILKAQGLSREVILCPPEHLTYQANSFYFSETKLVAYFKENVQFQSCTVLGHVCAQEQIPKYDYLVNEGHDLLETFFPRGCGEALFEAKVFSAERYPGLAITHHYCNGNVVPGRFWGQVQVA